MNCSSGQSIELFLGFTAPISNLITVLVTCGGPTCVYGWNADFSGPASLELVIRDISTGTLISGTQFIRTVNGNLFGVCYVSFSTVCDESESFDVSGHSSNDWRAIGTNGQMEGYWVGAAAGGSLDFCVQTPEPGTLLIFGSGVVGLAGLPRRKLMW